VTGTSLFLRFDFTEEEAGLVTLRRFAGASASALDEDIDDYNENAWVGGSEFGSGSMKIPFSMSEKFAKLLEDS
jgi:hypothetical protein